MSQVSVGDLVCYKRGWTAIRTHVARVVTVETDDSGETVYTLDDGHWCYAGQIFGSADGTGYAVY